MKRSQGTNFFIKIKNRRPIRGVVLRMNIMVPQQAIEEKKISIAQVSSRQ